MNIRQLRKFIQKRTLQSQLIRWTVIILLAMIYYCAGIYGRQVALPPGYATTLWPPSGISLAFILLLGYRIWPGIFLGSFTHNLFIDGNIHVTDVDFFIGLAIATGTTIQAILAGYLIRKYIKTNDIFSDSNRVFLYIVFALFSCLISSSVGVISLSIVGVTPWKDYLSIWLTWWIGDVSGILIFTSLILCWVIKPITNLSLFKIVEAIILLSVLLYVEYAVLMTKKPYLYMFIPILVWGAFRFKAVGAVTLVFLVANSLVFVTAKGMGFIISNSIYESLVYVETFNTVTTIMTLFLVAALAERDKAQESLNTYNIVLEEKVKERTKEIQRNIQKVQKMQKQIITQEKLASLGTLTAGIAHEIKNPLNFIENFSDLCVKQISRIAEQIQNQKEKIEESSYVEINKKLDLLKLNLNKIIEYGKKADFIIESMLMHAREKSGTAQLVDINQLFDEYLKLSYHVARHKDPSFNVTLNTTYDKTIGKVQIIPNDVSRVFLNLLNNAFYSLQEKKKKLGDQYSPFLNIKSANLGDLISISIYDNGLGISTEVKKKLFTPFFTTKPAGEGTGLGLSISHDIIVSSHGGSIKVDAKVGEYAEFTIILPKKRDVFSHDEEKEEK